MSDPVITVCAGNSARKVMGCSAVPLRGGDTCSREVPRATSTVSRGMATAAAAEMVRKGADSVRWEVYEVVSAERWRVRGVTVFLTVLVCGFGSVVGF